MKNSVMSNNEFVKKGQNNMKSMMGDRPGVPAEMKKFNAFMSNNERSVDAIVSKATDGLDKKAFPVK